MNFGGRLHYVMPPLARSYLRVWLAIFLFALAARLGYEALVWHGPLGNPDTAAYEDLAARILNFQPYQTSQGAGPGGFPSDLQRPPGYPAYLAAISAVAHRHSILSRQVLSLTQCVLGALFASLLALLVTELSSLNIGVAAGLFYALDWSTIVYTPIIVSETLYSIVLGLAILTYALALSRESKRLVLLAGLCLGCAALVKPAAQVLIPAFLLGWFFTRPRRWAGLLFLAAYLVCVFPWMVRNDRTYGSFSLSRIDVANLYFYIAKPAEHSYSVRDLAGEQLTSDVQQLDEQWRSRHLTVNQRSRELLHEALPIIARHWPTVLKQAAIGFSRTLLGTSSVTAMRSMPSPPSRAGWVLLNVVPLLQMCLLTALAIWGCWTPELSCGLKVLLVGAVFCVLMPAAGPVAQSRFRLPATPALCILAAAGAVDILRRTRSRTAGGWGPSRVPRFIVMESITV